MTDRKPFAVSIRTSLPGEEHSPVDELGYSLDEPALAVVTGFPEDVNLLREALRCIGFDGTLVLSGGVIYGPEVSRCDLRLDWTIRQAGTGRRLAVIKYDLSPREGTWAEWRARATELGIALIFLKRCVAGRQEVWDRVCTALEAAGLGSPPAEHPGGGVANGRGQPAEQPAEQHKDQARPLADGRENALETQRGDASARAARRGDARDLDELVIRAKGRAAPLPPPRAGEGSAGRTLRISEDPDAKSRAGRELAGRRWSRRGA